MNAPWKSKASIEADRVAGLSTYIDQAVTEVTKPGAVPGGPSLYPGPVLRVLLEFVQPDDSAKEEAPAAAVSQSEATAAAPATAATESPPTPAAAASEDATVATSPISGNPLQSPAPVVAPVVPTEEETIIAVMTVVKKSQIRAGFEMGTEKAGVAAKGQSRHQPHPQA